MTVPIEPLAKTIPIDECIPLLHQYSLNRTLPNILIQIPKSDPHKEFIITIIFKGAISALDSRVQLILEEQKVDELWILKQMVEKLQTDLHSLQNQLIYKPKIYQFFSTGINITTTTWTDLPGLSTCKVISMGHVKITMDFSVIGTHHGGIRIIVDKGLPSEKIFGGDPSYGLDWVLPTSSVWAKRSLVRVLTVKEGSRIITVQVRSQTEGGSFLIHTGNAAQSYSGFWFFVENVDLVDAE